MAVLSHENSQPVKTRSTTEFRLPAHKLTPTFCRPEYDFVARWILSLLIVLYSMDVFFSMCVGCAMFQLLILCGIVPPSICEKCSVVFTTKTQQPNIAKSIPLQPYIFVIISKIAD